MNADIKIIQKSISLLLVAENQPVHLDVALAIIYVYLLKHDIKNTCDEEVFISMCSGFRRKYRTLANRIVTSPYKYACEICFKHLRTIDFEEKKNSLKSISAKLKIIANIEEDGYLSLSDKLFPTYLNMLDKTTRIDDLLIDDISWDKEKVEDTNSDNDLIPVVTNVNENMGTNQIDQSQDRNLDDFKDLYSKLKSKDGRENCKYAWQWLLTQKEYVEIKECIEKHQNELPKRGKLKNFPELVNVITLYFGEYYKREYNGNNGEETFDIALDTLCELACIPYYVTDDTTRWKFSLYVNGGLPVNYIVKKLKNNDRSAFINCLAILFDPEDELEKEQGRQLLNKLGNTSLVGSYNRKDSIYEYIDYINRDLRTWDESDDTGQTFIDFKKLIEEGKNAFKDKAKFRLDYSLWKYSDELELSTDLRFNVEEDGERHYAINESRLKDWGVKVPENEFRLVLKEDDKALVNICFGKCNHGDYIESRCSSLASLPTLSKNDLNWSKIALNDYNLVFCSDTEETVLRRSIIKSPDGCLQFYTNDSESCGEQWTSNKGGRLYVKSAVMFDTTRFEAQNCKIELLNDNLGWVVFQSHLALIDKKKNKKINLYNSKGSFVAVPTSDSIHDLIRNDIVICTDENMLTFVNNEQQTEPVYIVKKSGLKFSTIKEKTQEELDIATTITYSQREYIDQEYTKDVILEQGFVRFTVRFGSYKSDVLCFVLNDDAKVEIKNTGRTYRLDFNGIESLLAISKGYSLSNGNQCTDSANGTHEDIEFEISDAMGWLKFKTFRPKPAVIAKFPDNTKVQNNLLVCFAHRYNIRVINGGSGSTLRLAENKDVYKFLFRVLTSTTKKDNDSSPNSTKKIKELDSKVPDAPLVLKVFTHEIQDTTQLNSDDFYFLTFNNLELRHLSFRDNRPVIDYVHDAQKEMGGNAGLLFQSIKGVSTTEILYASRYVPGEFAGKYCRIDKIAKRTERLLKYVDKKAYADEFASMMFDIADEHGLYFAQFDNLLSILWDKEKNDFLSERYMQKRRSDGNLIKTDKPNPKLYKRVADFLNTYSQYHPEIFSLDGLLRLSREFMFDWAELEKVKQLKPELSEGATSILKILIETK